MKLSGNKTHLAVAVILVLCVCKWQGWLKVPDEVYVAILAVGLSFLRAGVAKAEKGIAPRPLAYTDHPMDLLPDYPPQPKVAPPVRVEVPAEAPTLHARCQACCQSGDEYFAFANRFPVGTQLRCVSCGGEFTIGLTKPVPPIVNRES